VRTREPTTRCISRVRDNQGGLVKNASSFGWPFAVHRVLGRPCPSRQWAVIRRGPIFCSFLFLFFSSFRLFFFLQHPPTNQLPPSLSFPPYPAPPPPPHPPPPHIHSSPPPHFTPPPAPAVTPLPMLILLSVFFCFWIAGRTCLLSLLTPRARRPGHRPTRALVNCMACTFFCG